MLEVQWKSTCVFPHEHLGQQWFFCPVSISDKGILSSEGLFNTCVKVNTAFAKRLVVEVMQLVANRQCKQMRLPIDGDCAVVTAVRRIFQIYGASTVETRSPTAKRRYGRTSSASLSDAVNQQVVTV